MQYDTDPEYWLRGPVDQVPALLQPVAHALLQARAEVNRLMKDFPESKLWTGVAGLASPGFHLQHIAGVIDRLFTYARREGLSAAQMEQLKAEGVTVVVPLTSILDRLNRQVDLAMDQLKLTGQGVLTETRFVGRKQIPTTVIGLYTHAAEHAMRHVGQLLVTVQVL